MSQSGPADAAPSEPVRVNEGDGSVRASALSRARLVVDNAGGVHVLYPVTGISPTTGKPVINVRYQKLTPRARQAPRPPCSIHPLTMT